jgi:hypothetical protein
VCTRIRRCACATRSKKFRLAREGRLKPRTWTATYDARTTESSFAPGESANVGNFEGLDPCRPGQHTDRFESSGGNNVGRVG